MKDLKQTLAKGALGTVAAGAMALASATPAAASDRHRDRGIDAGDVIAGAVIIGGIAAIAGAFDNDDRYDRRDRRYRDRRYNDRYAYNGNYNRGGYGYNGRDVVEQCIRTAERQARRYGWRYADVTQIRDVDRTRYGFRVKGRIEVQDARRYRGQDYDRGRFTCNVEYGNRPTIRFDGIRGVR